MKNFLYWSPRVLGILAILFISLFSLDVFQSGLLIPKIFIAFGMHLIPSFFLLVFLLIAWKWELVGGIIFMLVSAVPFLALNNSFWTNSMLSMPFVITGVLFILCFYYLRNKEIKVI